MRHIEPNQPKLNKAEPIDRLWHDLQRVLDARSNDIDRVEILAAGMYAFCKPVPDYEPRFQHLRDVTRFVRELH
ncbi:MAG: hypothetical protein ABI830_11670 [Pseudolabrys sp.]